MLYGRRGGVYHQMYRDITTLDPLTGAFRLQNTPEARAAFLREREGANTDWFRHLFRLVPTTTHTLTFSAGSDKIATYASLSYLNDPGWSITDRVDRFTAKLKSTYYITDQLEATLTLDGNICDQRAPEAQYHARGV